MLVQFTSAGGKESWVAEIESLKDRLLLEEFKRGVPRLAGSSLEVQWIDPQYMGRVLQGLYIVGRFWREEASETVGA